MTDEEAVAALQEGYEFLCSQARIIAMLPLEQWQADLDHAESVGPFLDPTLYREYMYSEKPKVLKEVLAAAIKLKQAVLKVQPAHEQEVARRCR